MTRYVFITGGVVSSLGKGLAAAALAALLQARGYKVRLRKLDPYLNVDPGTMSPYQHGEVYVTDDGAETDLDLGHYERFTGVAAHQSDNVTSGRIYQTIIAKIKAFSSQGKKTAVISTINGDSNVPFYKELGNAGLKAKDVPVVAFSVGEEELRGVDAKPLVGHLAAWNYFMSVKNPTNAAFIQQWSAYAKAKGIAGHKDKPLTNDPMEATWIGIHMWKQAVEKAKSTDVDKVIAAMAGQSFAAPDGFTVKMDEKNHHLHKPVMVGEIKADGQFSVVWKTKGPIKAQPWSPYIEGNDKKKDEPDGKSGS